MLLTRNLDGTEVADFELAFTLGQKAIVTEEDDGHIIIEGIASDFGMDRQDEAFEEGAFEEGIKAYLSSNPILLYHHKTDTALGQTLDLKIIEHNGGKALYAKARVDKPEPGTIVADYVQKIKNGTLRAFSVGGKFYRRMTENGPRIFKCDLRELSVTPLAVNPRSLFQIAGKAFETPEGATVTNIITTVPPELEEQLERIGAILDGAEAALDGKAVRPPSEGQTPQAAQTARKSTAQHPDAAPVAALLMHMQRIHTLAENTKQNASDPEVAEVADKASKSLAKHVSTLHHIAARIGPLPDYYGSGPA